MTYNDINDIVITVNKKDNDKAEFIVDPKGFTVNEGDKVESKIVLTSRPKNNVRIKIENSLPLQLKVIPNEIIFDDLVIIDDSIRT